jgi:hypothetical protein
MSATMALPTKQLRCSVCCGLTDTGQDHIECVAPLVRNEWLAVSTRQWKRAAIVYGSRDMAKAEAAERLRLPLCVIALERMQTPPQVSELIARGLVFKCSGCGHLIDKWTVPSLGYIPIVAMDGRVRCMPNCGATRA